MSEMKRKGFILFFIFLALIEIAIYWNYHLYHKAEMTADVEEKIRILEKANRLFPFNDLVYYKLGGGFYDLAIRNLNDDELSISLLQKSVSHYRRSLLFNPASQYSHFSLARTLFYLNVLSPSSNLLPEDELKKAIFLVDHNSEIFFEAGKLFLGRWDELSEEDRIFASGILRKIMESKNREKLQILFHVWEINVKDYETMSNILPEDPFVFRRMAEYLGERSLFLEERHRLLAEAEFLEFEEARRDHQKGEKEFYAYNLNEAAKHFRSCINALNKIRFYQELSQQNLIVDPDYDRFLRSSYLYLAKCVIEENGILAPEVKDYLERYLRSEENLRAINELELYLVDRRIISKRMEDNLDKLDQLSFHLFLALKQARYTDITRIGQLVHVDSAVVPEEMRSAYIRIQQIVGEALQRIDSVYDARDWYQRAYALDPQNLGTLLKMIQNYSRLGDQKEVQKLHDEVERILYPKNTNFAIHLVRKRRQKFRSMVLDGREILLSLFFDKNLGEVPPLVAINFNGRVVWENYLQNNVLSLSLKSKVGENNILIIAVNKDISLKKMTYEFVD